ncbi:YqaA family protein [Pseudidiomarina terrestris]|uniref:DedA family protein n=1 Tax=Pseudidiomarina terrestris TaxID=2820060 RepID=A0AAW7QZH6_9GAMM|nr:MULTISPECIES: VTT domain-containing protein [unclassified Pseudidiomarina]MDN7123760.1 DedA family protein [Pseudidiomarina sp. 1APP75-32.1]MDN7126426.1 DedA family protein [Pseudidiomarina sp. 1APR75-33.1]MDN7135236.1 DedA family protein [Pseudidiomarina sp. 1ASP75-5]MDN7137909.1 DedA family protein [Pseudidiomarina sp. 1ASP75-14]MEA3586994.1 DedA family protein [Pseudidiomarina sp. 1APP75-27a]
MRTPDDQRANKWLARILDSNRILWMIFLLSLLESIILPVPLELVLIPLLIHERDRWFTIATVALAGCLVGATIGYTIGVFFFDTAGQWLIQWFGVSAEFSEFQQDFSEHGFATLLLVGITPIPFQVGMLAAGSSNYPYLLFLLAAVIARGIRYYGLALLVNWLGERILNWWEQHQQRLGWGVLVAGIAIYLVVVLN